MQRRAAPAVAVVVVVALLVASSAPVRAEADAHRLEIAASLGYAGPVGEAERGARVRDTTFGATPLALDASWRLAPIVAVALHASWGPTIPTLCASAGDCVASLGSDTSIALAGRVLLPHVGRLEPWAEVGVGYEWLTTRLVDSGATASRSYHGPTVAIFQLAAPVRLGERWTLGPVLGASLGTFTGYSLQTNAASPSGSVAATAVHTWLSVGVRIGFSP
jgi:hypothetical protein